MMIKRWPSHIPHLPHHKITIYGWSTRRPPLAQVQLQRKRWHRLRGGVRPGRCGWRRRPRHRLPGRLADRDRAGGHPVERGEQFPDRGARAAAQVDGHGRPRPSEANRVPPRRLGPEHLSNKSYHFVTIDEKRIAGDISPCASRLHTGAGREIIMPKLPIVSEAAGCPLTRASVPLAATSWFHEQIVVD